MIRLIQIVIIKTANLYQLPFYFTCSTNLVEPSYQVQLPFKESVTFQTKATETLSFIENKFGKVNKIKCECLFSQEFPACINSNTKKCTSAVFTQTWSILLATCYCWVLGDFISEKIHQLTSYIWFTAFILLSSLHIPILS